MTFFVSSPSRRPLLAVAEFCHASLPLRDVTRAMCRFMASCTFMFWVFFGGGGCRFYFHGREDFSDLCIAPLARYRAMPLKKAPVHPFCLVLRGGSHVKQPSERCRATPLYRSYSHDNLRRSNTVSRDQKINANFFAKSFSRTLRVMDVRAENRGRPHQKMRFSAAPMMGRNFLTPGHPGVRVRNVRGKSGPKSLCLCCFFLP